MIIVLLISSNAIIYISAYPDNGRKRIKLWQASGGYSTLKIWNPPGNNSVEFKVKVININSDKAHGLLKKCDVLRDTASLLTQ